MLIYGDKDWSRIPEQERTKAALRNARLFTLQNIPRVDISSLD
jgi:hypothetical protein